MAKTKKQKTESNFTGLLAIKRQAGKIYSHIRKKWLVETPEERVRQEYLCILVNEYGYSLDQIDEEIKVPGRGSGRGRADFLIWRTPQEKGDKKKAFIVVECKSDNITIAPKDYDQGANYAQYENAPFFVTHNNRETKYWKVDHNRRMPNYDEIENIPHAEASDKDVKDLLEKLKVLNEKEFADLLHQCHNIIRNREKKDPAAAFDEIAKILFIKVDIERKWKSQRLKRNLFTKDFLEEQKSVFGDPINSLFDQTKKDYRADGIFADDEKVNLKYNTAKEIVEKLERYNLSDTSEDIKGIAFERFLGRTFRGEIGQFFTPRTIVEFMVRMVDPQEGDVVCDPASGSGGFLIRVFEIVKEKILANVDTEYQTYKAELDKKRIDETKKAELLREKYDELQKSIDQSKEGSRLWTLSNRCIYGTDANDRMARTSKMNMIMHGDGHGGIHHHDGFLNVNGIFEERFDVVLTNPPFGANVEPSDVVLEQDIAVTPEALQKYEELFGELYIEARERVIAQKGKAIASLFDLPKSNTSNIKTEILFIERCLDLLTPGGRLGIVLPEGVYNNPSLQYVRDFCEDRAYLKAVVSLPQETFFASGASVKASLLFMQKFTEQEKTKFEKTCLQSTDEIKGKYAKEIATETARLEGLIETAKKDKDTDKRKLLQKELTDYIKQMNEKIATESRSLLKVRFNYPVFFYDAEKVGITATGEEDQNELYPNNNQPNDIEKTALEHYHCFSKNPQSYLSGAKR
ncbi:MAG: N-6 DNA methylase [Syntrophaceae bacterium]|nr:N-6 DNA methylase [Syntrophaceae bacterium]